MPPNPRITEQMVLEAALEVIRKDGYENLNVRSIAKELNCSTQPVLYRFKTINQIRKAVYQLADQYHTAYIMPKQEDLNPLLSLGLNYIRFAREEKNLFRFLFQSNQFQDQDFTSLMDHPSFKDIQDILAQKSGCSQQQAREIFLTLFATVHGFASMLANNALEYDENQCARILSRMFTGLLSSGGIDPS